MNAVFRVLAAIALVFVIGSIANLSSGGSDATDNGENVRDGVTQVANGAPRFQSSAECRSCHEEVWDEWYGSHHQISYENPEVRKLSNDFRNKECQSCHLPQPISVTGYERRSLPRQSRFSEGVGCISCHLGADGRVIGRRAREDVPCKPVANEEFVTEKFCASCHNQHYTTDQYRSSHYPEAGVSCASCHMEEVERSHGGIGRKHVFPGAHDLPTLRSAARFEARFEDGKLVVETENVGAGHNMPTEERHRAVDVMTRFELEDGSMTDWHRSYRFRMAYRDAPDLLVDPPIPTGESTQLEAGKTHVLEREIPEGAVRAEARLWYRLNPFAVDEDDASSMLYERKVELR